MKLMLLAALGAALAGCATKTGRAYPVIGFGYVIVSTNQPSAVSVKVLGLCAGGGQASLGLSSLTVTTIPTNASVIIDLRK